MRLVSRRSVVGGIAAGGSLATIGGLRAQQANTIRIGVVQTLSGSIGDIGKYHLTGSQIAVKEINESGGIDGRMVELVIRDSKFSATDSIGALRELAGMGVNFVHGEFASGLVNASLPVLDDLNIIYIAPSVILMDATHDKYNRHFFRCGANAHMSYRGEAQMMARYAPTAKRWGAVVADVLGQRSVWDAIQGGLRTFYPKVANTQVEIIDAVITKPGTTDFRNAISQLAAQNLGGIHIGVVGGEAVTFLQQARPFNLFQHIKAVADTALAAQAGPILKTNTPPNFWSCCVWFYDGYKQVPLAQRFYKDITAETKDPIVNWLSALGHNVVMSFAGAVRAAKSTDTQKVINALETVEFDSIFGPLRYRKEDHQLLVNPGYIHLEPQEADPGYRIAGYVTLPWQDLIEPPSPGVAFKEG